MRRSEARITHLSVWLVSITGLVYGGLLYFAESSDEFGPVTHPWVPLLHTLHVLLVPLFVFAVGMLWQHHIVAKLRSGAHARRISGMSLVLLALVMVASGYLVQVTTADVWRSTWKWMHGISSCLFVLAFCMHLLGRVAPAARIQSNTNART